MRGLVYLKKPVDTNDSIKRYNKLNFLICNYKCHKFSKQSKGTCDINKKVC